MPGRHRGGSRSVASLSASIPATTDDRSRDRLRWQQPALPGPMPHHTGRQDVCHGGRHVLVHQVVRPHLSVMGRAGQGGAAGDVRTRMTGAPTGWAAAAGRQQALLLGRCADTCRASALLARPHDERGSPDKSRGWAPGCPRWRWRACRSPASGAPQTSCGWWRVWRAALVKKDAGLAHSSAVPDAPTCSPQAHRRYSSARTLAHQSQDTPNPVCPHRWSLSARKLDMLSWASSLMMRHQ